MLCRLDPAILPPCDGCGLRGAGRIPHGDRLREIGSDAARLGRDRSRLRLYRVPVFVASYGDRLSPLQRGRASVSMKFVLLCDAYRHLTSTGERAAMTKTMFAALGFAATVAFAGPAFADKFKVSRGSPKCRRMPRPQPVAPTSTTIPPARFYMEAHLFRSLRPCHCRAFPWSRRGRQERRRRGRDPECWHEPRPSRR